MCSVIFFKCLIKNTKHVSLQKIEIVEMLYISLKQNLRNTNDKLILSEK